VCCSECCSALLCGVLSCWLQCALQCMLQCVLQCAACDAFCVAVRGTGCCSVLQWVSGMCWRAFVWVFVMVFDILKIQLSTVIAVAN